MRANVSDMPPHMTLVWCYTVYKVENCPKELGQSFPSCNQQLYKDGFQTRLAFFWRKAQVQLLHELCQNNIREPSWIYYSIRSP